MRNWPCHWEHPILRGLWAKIIKWGKTQNPNTYKPQVIEHHWRDWSCVDPTLVTFWRLCFFQTVRRHALEHPRGIVDRRVTKFVKVWKLLEDLPRVIARGLCDLSSRRIRWGLGVLSCVLRTGCTVLCVLEFKYSTTPTKRTTEIAVGTGLPNYCLCKCI